MTCDGSRSIPVWDGAGERLCPGCSACAGLPAVETTMRSSQRASDPRDETARALEAQQRQHDAELAAASVETAEILHDALGDRDVALRDLAAKSREYVEMTNWRDEALGECAELEMTLASARADRDAAVEAVGIADRRLAALVVDWQDGEEARASAVAAFDALCSRMATIVDEAFGPQEALPPAELLTRLEELFFERRRRDEQEIGEWRTHGVQVAHERDTAIQDRDDARRERDVAACLARNLGQALDAIREHQPSGWAASQVAAAALRSLTGEECRIIDRAAVLKTDESRCAACGAEAHPEFGITVDGVARPLCTGCGDTGTRCCTPEMTAEREVLRAKIRARDASGARFRIGDDEGSFAELTCNWGRPEDLERARKLKVGESFVLASAGFTLERIS